MARPTIRDLADAAGVSPSTVNRVLAGSDKVREATMQRVLDTARDIGFYGTGALRNRVAATRPRDRFVVLLQQPGRQFYETLAQHLRAAAGDVVGRDIDLAIEFMNDLSPEHVAGRMLALGQGADALAVVTAEHPIITGAVDRLRSAGTPVLALVSPLTARTQIGFIGLDSWKLGRTVGWFFENICREPGKIGVLVGNHRYLNQDMQESGFRSYLREHGDGFRVLEPLPTFESTAIAREMTERLLTDHPDMVGLYVCGGGISGALAALRGSDRAGTLKVIGYDLMESTRAGLADGTLTIVLSHPFRRLAVEAIEAMVAAKSSQDGGSGRRLLVDFEIYTRENI